MPNTASYTSYSDIFIQQYQRTPDMVLNLDDPRIQSVISYFDNGAGADRLNNAFQNSASVDGATAIFWSGDIRQGDSSK